MYSLKDLTQKPLNARLIGKILSALNTQIIFKICSFLNNYIYYSVSHSHHDEQLARYPSPRKLRQENHYEFKANLGYQMSLSPA